MNIDVKELLVRLQNEGTDVYKKTNGYKVATNTFVILVTEDYDPDDEEWEFVPGSIVKCVLEQHGGREWLVAHELVSQ